MIRIDKPKFKFLYAGHELEVDVSREYRKGRVYAAGKAHNKTASCQVQVTSCKRREGGWTITVKRLSGDVVRLMGRSGGYVTAAVELNPDDPDVLVGGWKREPEPIDPLYVRRYAETNHARDEQLRREAAHRRRLERRNPSATQVKSPMVPPASDIQAAVPENHPPAFPNTEAA